MKRHLMAVMTAVLFALALTGTAAASGLGSPLGGQSNSSDQQQLQVVPIAPQVNVQNVAVGNQGDVEQGNANNANTGQANQQENTVVGGSADSKHEDADSSTTTSKTSCGCPKHDGGSKNSTTDQSNHSDQSQVQIVPIAPQVNVQNVAAGNHGDVEQGNANNANTGQANQQENTQVSGSGGREKDRFGHDDSRGEKGREWSSHKRSDGSVSARQSNRSEQHQFQFVPIAPQLNVQNVALLNDGDVEQGNANNANTGQANQQENTASAGHGSDGSWDGKWNDGRSSGSVSARQRNSSEQKQGQFIPIAPQLNVQNVALLNDGDVEQGNANNANTGQANQQENTASAGRGDEGKWDNWDGKRSDGGSVSARQSNWSSQRQFQFIPIAPQLNVQNVAVGNQGDVEQGNANNANTGQANQQQNTAVGGPEKGAHFKGHPKGHGCDNSCGRPKCDPCGTKRPKHDCNKPKGRKVEHRRPAEVSQRNSSKQRQFQFVPIAPQANFQNVAVGSGGKREEASRIRSDGGGRIEQGNANNANTGQANQQENTVRPAEHHERRPDRGPTPIPV